MSREHTDRGKRTDSKKNLSQCHCVRHKHHTDRTGNEAGAPQWRAGDYWEMTWTFITVAKFQKSRTIFSCQSSLPDILIKV